MGEPDLAQGSVEWLLNLGARRCDDFRHAGRNTSSGGYSGLRVCGRRLNEDLRWLSHTCQSISGSGHQGGYSL